MPSLTELNIYKFEVEKFLGVQLDTSAQKLCVGNFLNIDIPCAYTIDYKHHNGAYTIFNIYAFTESTDVIYVKHQIKTKLGVKVNSYDDDCELAEVVCFNRNAALQKLVEDDITVNTEQAEVVEETKSNIIDMHDCKRKIFDINA